MSFTNRYLFEDKITATKIKNDPSYYDKLEAAYNYIVQLKIKNIVEFSGYIAAFDILNEVTYPDVLAFARFQNKEYYEYIKECIKPPVTKKDFVIIKKQGN